MQKIVKKRLMVAVLVVTVGAILWNERHRLSIEDLAERQATLEQWRNEHPVSAFGASFATYAVATGLSLPVGAAMSILIGWYFGWTAGVLLVSFASTCGATFAFLLSRYLFRDLVEKRLGERAEKVQRAIEREGAWYLFTLRMIPVLPFFMINSAMGLTRIRTWTYWWVSQLGMLPATMVYVFAGSRIPDLNLLAEQGVRGVMGPERLVPMAVAFALLGLFPLLARCALREYTTHTK